MSVHFNIFIKSFSDLYFLNLIFPHFKSIKTAINENQIKNI